MIGLHVRRGARGDLQGRVAFEDVWLARLPRMTLISNSKYNVYTDPSDVRVTCSLSGIGDVPLWAMGPAILLAIGGTSLAPFVIERMSDHGFRQWTRAIIFAISVVYLFRAGWLIWHRY